MFKVSAYTTKWSPEVDVPAQSICVNLNGQKAYVFYNKELDLLGVNLFDSDGIKTLSFYGIDHSDEEEE